MMNEQLLNIGEQLFFKNYNKTNVMINIEQFRIGNYVLADRILRKICYLNNYGDKGEQLIGFEIDDHVEYEDAGSARLESVSLTDQLLVNLGFTFHPHFKVWQHSRPERTYSIELDNDYFPLDFSHQPIVQHMKQLHQLQNLFFTIQGQELTFQQQQGKTPRQ